MIYTTRIKWSNGTSICSYEKERRNRHLKISINHVTHPTLSYIYHIHFLLVYYNRVFWNNTDNIRGLIRDDKLNIFQDTYPKISAINVINKNNINYNHKKLKYGHLFKKELQSFPTDFICFLYSVNYFLYIIFIGKREKKMLRQGIIHTHIRA